jgi:putative SOS response-associated peptidase YedK
VLAAAGIWRDSEIPSFAILTVEAMPVILHPQDHGTWLHADFKLARRLVER